MMADRMRGWMGCIVVAGLFGAVAPLAAQDVVGTAAQQVQDIETMKDKFVSLARAFDEAQMEWRPMEGVRSVKEVVDLTAAEVHLFPTLWGFEPPAHSAAGFEAEMNRLGEESPADAIAEMEAGFDRMIALVGGLSAERLHEPSDWFGTTYTVEASIAQALGDMHEHLGQLIAYARTNGVVPPWSR